MPKFVIRNLLPVIALALLPVSVIQADPDEAWLERASLPLGLRPLLVLIVDTSAASAASITGIAPYDPMRDYARGLPGISQCDPALVYWRRGPGPQPDCAQQTGLQLHRRSATHGLHCDAARMPLAQQGFFIASRAAQWRPAAEGGQWMALRPDRTDAVECRSDRASHGSTAGAWYAADGPRGPWSGDAEDEISWDRPPHADPYIFYGGNYLNYLRSTPEPIQRPFVEYSTAMLTAALLATDELEVALLRLPATSSPNDGAFVARAAVAPAVAAAQLRQIAAETPDGGAPLAEALFETASWLTGSAVYFGGDERSDPAAQDPGTGRYRSPFTHACRPISAALMTPGISSDDESAATAAASLPDFDQQTGGCGADCLPALVRWIEQTDLRADLPGHQSVPVAKPARVDDPVAFINLIARSLQRDAAIAGEPQLSAAGLIAEAGGTHAPAVVFGLIAPRVHARWSGNLFRYALKPPSLPLEPPQIVDRDGEPAIDGTSAMPLPGSRSLWSDAPDADLLAGGAAGRLPGPESRRLYTELVTPRIADPANRLEIGNRRLDRGMFGLGESDAESPDDIVAWLAGLRSLGDPGLSPPTVVRYAGDDSTIVYVASHDGLLHAFDGDSGVERWAWMPHALLPRTAELMRNEATTVRSHGIDGPLVVHRHDPDGDGDIDVAAGEHLWLLFGLGRGGNGYYALDISSPDDPRLNWAIESPGAGDVESWPEPVAARLTIGGSGQSAGDWVVLLSGGYDPRSESAPAAVTGTGNTLQAVDALSGRTLWQAGSDRDSDLVVPDFVATAPSAPRALDLDGDGRVDRAYLVDAAGDLWRFDFTNDRPASELASARLIAKLGAGAQRYFATPDVSITELHGRRQIAVAVGSGRISRPRHSGAIDRLSVVFDRGSSAPAPLEADLHDATAGNQPMPATAPGWFVRLERHGAGEMVIGPSVTFDHLLRFQTWQPQPAEAASPCGPPRAIRRLYALDVRSGLPASTVDRPAEEETELEGAGLPVALRYAFPADPDSACDGCRPRPFGIAGSHVFDAGYAGDPVRTSWRKLQPQPDSR